MTTDPFIRRYLPSDRARLADIRVRTAHEGGDSSGRLAVADPGPVWYLGRPTAEDTPLGT